MKHMLDKYLNLKTKYLKLEEDLQNPTIIADQNKLKVASQEYSELKPVYEKIVELENIERNTADTKAMIESETETEMKSMLEIEIAELKNKLFDNQDMDFLHINPSSCLFVLHFAPNRHNGPRKSRAG